MKIEEAYNKIKKFSTLNTEHEHINNKGSMGHVLEKALGLNLNSNLMDFEDGELKTFHYNERNEVKEDFRITSRWNLDEIKMKLEQLLVVGANLNNQIEFMKIVRPLENIFFLEQLEIEVPFIIEKGPMNCSQADTNVFIAKTQGRGGGAPKERSLYISRPWAHALFHGVYPKRARKGKHLVAEFELSLK
jgi:hypothetical protein